MQKKLETRILESRGGKVRLDRLRWAEETLHWTGMLNREDLTSRFGIGRAQAAADLRFLLEEVVGKREVYYDKSAAWRCYRAKPGFQPRLIKPELARWLRLRDADLEVARPGLDVVGRLERDVDPDVARNVFGGKRKQRPVRIRYQAMTSPEETERVVSFHAGFDNGEQILARGWCHLRGEYRNFSLSRIWRAEMAVEENWVSPDGDGAWINMITLILVPHPGLTDGQRRITEKEWGMNGGERTFTLREAFVYSFCKKYFLLPEFETLPANLRPVILAATKGRFFRIGDH